MKIKVMNGSTLSRFNEGWISGAIYFSSDMYELKNVESENYFNNHNKPFGILDTIYDVSVEKNSKHFSDNDFHPHDNIDIISYVVDGVMYDGVADEKMLAQLGHVNEGIDFNSECSRQGGVQYLSSGKGIHHSVYSKEGKALRFIQLFISTNKKDSLPMHKIHSINIKDRQGKWLLIASSISNATALKVTQDINVFVLELMEGQEISVNVSHLRQACLLVIDGCGKLNQTHANKSDLILLSGEFNGIFKAKSKSHLMLIEMKLQENRV